MSTPVVIPNSHSGRGIPYPSKPKAPKAPRGPKGPGKARIPGAGLDPSTSQAMGLFRSTLAQIRSLQKPVDVNAISQPYRDASTATGQLGAGLAQAVTQTGAQAQQQYGQGRDEAVQHAAQFGVSAGAGADPMMRPGELGGDQLLAQQTQAQSAAANQAAAAWQGLLERTRAGAVSKAQSDRATQDNQVATTLAGNVPGWIQNAKTLAFQKDTANKNYLLALGNAKDKRTNAYRDYLLNQIKAGNTADYQQGMLDIGQQNADSRTQANTDRVAHWGTVEKRLTAAAKAKGLGSGDVSQILKTLKGPTGSSQRKMTGYDIVIQSNYPGVGLIPGTAQHITSSTPNPNIAQLYPGYEQVGTGTEKWTTTGAGAQKFSWSRYRAAANLAQAIAKQRGVTLSKADIIQMLGPTPKTGKK